MLKGSLPIFLRFPFSLRLIVCFLFGLIRWDECDFLDIDIIDIIVDGGVIVLLGI